MKAGRTVPPTLLAAWTLLALLAAKYVGGEGTLIPKHQTNRFCYDFFQPAVMCFWIRVPWPCRPDDPNEATVSFAVRGS